MSTEIQSVIQRLALGGYDSRELYGMIETLKAVEVKVANCEKENDALKAKIERLLQDTRLTKYRDAVEECDKLRAENDAMRGMK